MGQSTDALLLYGVPLHEDEDLSYDEDDSEATTSGPRYMAFMGNAEEGCIVVEHCCSNDSPMFFIAIEGTVTRAHRGYPKKIDGLDTTDNSPSWAKRLRSYCKKHNLSHLEPGWYLASMWS